MPRIAAIGFDLGDTLITYADTPLNWSALYSSALAHAAQCVGFALSADELRAGETILTRFNTRLHPRTEEVSAERIFGEMIAAWPSRRHLSPSLFLEGFFAFFQQRCVAYPETHVALAALRQRSLPLGVLTDTPYGMPRTFVEQDLRATSIAEFLDGWLTSVDVGWRKPSPQGIVALAKALNVECSALCYVGNEPKDIEAALAAGARPVLIDRAGVSPPWGQRHTLRDLSALPALIDTLR